jgi:hypothetical protein
MSFRLHIYDRPHNRPSCGVFDAFADPEVSDFDFSFGIDKDVLRFYVSVNGMSDVVDMTQS